MKKTLLITTIMIGLLSYGQNVNIDDANPTDCSFNFFDEGGAGSDYTSNSDETITLCPDTPGDFISVNFTSFNLENGYDYLLIIDGGLGGNLIGLYTGGSITPTVFTSSDPSGCLTFRFQSDGSVSASGWSATVSCTSIAGTQGIPAAPEDCSGGGGTTVCDDGQIAGNSNGGGTINDFVAGWGNDGCLAGENQTSWYYFRLDAGGTFGFDLDPAAGDDYDFAIWGPYPEIACPNVTGDAPLRCSYAAGSTNTGLDNSTAQTSEGVFGDGWVSDVTGSAGDTYVMVIDNYSATNDPFDLTWNLSGGASLDCTPLPVEFLDVSVEAYEEVNIVNWSTGSERNCDFYIIERSDNGGVYETVSQEIKGAGNSSETLFYEFIDENPVDGISYYRVKQFDFDQKSSVSDLVSVDRGAVQSGTVKLFPNPSADQFNIEYSVKYDETIQVSVLNLSGQVILSKVVETTYGKGKIIIDEINDAGIYQIHLRSENGEINQVLKAIKK